MACIQWQSKRYGHNVTLQNKPSTRKHHAPPRPDASSPIPHQPTLHPNSSTPPELKIQQELTTAEPNNHRLQTGALATGSSGPQFIRNAHAQNLKPSLITGDPNNDSRTNMSDMLCTLNVNSRYDQLNASASCLSQSSRSRHSARGPRWASPRHRRLIPRSLKPGPYTGAQLRDQKIKVA